MTTSARLLVGWLVCLAAGPALAQGSGDGGHFYLGVDIGRSELDRHEVFGDFASPSEQDATLFSVKAGYRFNPYFSLEGGYSDLGEYGSSLPGACPAVYTSVCPASGLRTSIKGIVLSAVGTWPLAAHLQLTASAGAIYRELQFSYDTLGGGSHSDKGTVWKYGIGVAVPIDDHFEIGLDVTQYRDIGLDLETTIGVNGYVVEDGDATAVTLGARWLF